MLCIAEISMFVLCYIYPYIYSCSFISGTIYHLPCATFMCIFFPFIQISISVFLYMLPIQSVSLPQQSTIWWSGHCDSRFQGDRFVVHSGVSQRRDTACPPWSRLWDRLFIAGGQAGVEGGRVWGTAVYRQLTHMSGSTQTQEPHHQEHRHWFWWVSEWREKSSFLKPGTMTVNQQMLWN